MPPTKRRSRSDPATPSFGSVSAGRFRLWVGTRRRGGSFTRRSICGPATGPETTGWRLDFIQGDYEAAAIEFRNVVEYAPSSYFGYNNLANVYDKLGLREDAFAALERSIELEPENNPYAFVNLGKLHFDDARFADAAELFEKTPSPSTPTAP